MKRTFFPAAATALCNPPPPTPAALSEAPTALKGGVSSGGGTGGCGRTGQPFGPWVGRHLRTKARVGVCRGVLGARTPSGGWPEAKSITRLPSPPRETPARGYLGPPSRGGGHGGLGQPAPRAPQAEPRPAARERCGLPLARPPVGGAELSPQPPPQPPPGPPRVPGGAAATAAASSMRTEPGPGHGDPQHHGPAAPGPGHL